MNQEHRQISGSWDLMPPVKQSDEHKEPEKQEQKPVEPKEEKKDKDSSKEKDKDKRSSPRLKIQDTLLSLPKDGSRTSPRSPKRPERIEGLLSLPPNDTAAPARVSPRPKREEARKNIWDTVAGKVAVITGASSGIGAAIARLLAQHGVKLVLGARRVPALEALKKEIEASVNGAKVVIARCDVTLRGDNAALVAKAEETFGSVDIFIANAGVMPLTLLKNVRLEEWDRMVDVNFKGLMYGVAAVLPTMLAKNAGDIIAISSDAGRKLFPGGTVYCATKWAVEAFLQGLRQETAGTNLRVCSIQPGATESELASHIKDPDVLAAPNPFKGVKILGAEDVANAVLFALSQPPHVSTNEILVRPTAQRQ